MDGVFGIYADRECRDDLFLGTFGLQDRGQEYCGLATSNGEDIKIRTAPGEVLQVFEKDLDGLDGHMGIGHTGSYEEQPMNREGNCGEFVVGYDGFIMNYEDLRIRLLCKGVSFATRDSVEVLAALIAREDTFAEGLEKALQKISGPCSLTMLTNEGIYAARGIEGWQPLVVGRNKHSILVASESCAFSLLGADIVRDVEPGEIVLINEEGVKTVKKLEGKRRICSFSWIYFARPDSVLDGVDVTDARHRLGGYLAEIDDVEADVVGPVPMSGISHADGYHLKTIELGRPIPNLQIFLPPRRIPRTYIRPIAKRLADKEKKLIPIRKNVRGKRLKVVDDSIRAGVIMRGTSRRLRNAGATEIHVRIASPISYRFCPYDRPPTTQTEFIAANHTLEEVRDYIEADTLLYQPFENVAPAIGLPEKDLCMDCFIRG